MHDRGAAVAAVCHGPAGLVSATGKVKLTAVVPMPFLLESRLRELGASFVAGPMWQPHAVRDGKLVTGQNPASSERAAKLVPEALQP